MARAEPAVHGGGGVVGHGHFPARWRSSLARMRHWRRAACHVHGNAGVDLRDDCAITQTMRRRRTAPRGIEGARRAPGSAAPRK